MFETFFDEMVMESMRNSGLGVINGMPGAAFLETLKHRGHRVPPGTAF
jgi:hypothetical protein